MINLLPPSEKNKRIQEKNLKLIWILGILITACLLSSGLILLSIKFYIANQAKIQESMVGLEREKTSQVQELQKKVNSVNKTLTDVDNFYQTQFNLSRLIERISGLFLSGIYLDSFSYQKDDSRITLSLYAPNIDKIDTFRERFRTQKDFEEVNFTVSEWLQVGDINFRVTFVIKK